MNLYRNESGDPKTNAQRNLCGRTHYVDDGTLRWHKSRVLRARVADGGLLFWIITSDALDMNNTKRGFRYVIFDLFGTTLVRPDLEHAFSKRATCEKAMWAALNVIDAVAHTREAIERSIKSYAEEMAWLACEVDKIKAEKGYGVRDAA